MHRDLFASLAAKNVENNIKRHSIVEWQQNNNKKQPAQKKSTEITQRNAYYTINIEHKHRSHTTMAPYKIKSV